MINGVIAQKLETMEGVLNELRSLGQIGIADLERDWKTRRAIERDLQVVIEIIIDICQRFIALAGQAPAATSSDAIIRCVQLGVLSDREAYRRVVRFRNFLVHRYDFIDLEILAEVINQRLTEFEQFRDDVLSYVQNH
ncbi:MAG: hypothetical protein Fur0021_06190 [Candidatus Promineifilaceae bacterium]